MEASICFTVYILFSVWRDYSGESRRWFPHIPVENAVSQLGKASNTRLRKCLCVCHRDHRRALNLGTANPGQIKIKHLLKHPSPVTIKHMCVSVCCSTSSKKGVRERLNENCNRVSARVYCSFRPCRVYQTHISVNVDAQTRNASQGLHSLGGPSAQQGACHTK